MFLKRSLWVAYREALTGADFVFALLTLVLTLVSWGLSLAGGPASVVAVTGVVGALVGGAPIAFGALKGVVARELNVDELVTIAIVASIVAGEYWGASLVAFMMLFGKVLEDVTAARAEHAIEGLGQLVPSVARLKDASGERTVPVDQVHPGNVLIVRPGERLPVDGEVVAGQAAVEEAAITGEPLPVDKGPGDSVYAGTLAAGGALEVKATRTGESTTLGRIASLVKEAESERAPIVRIADRWARWFTPTVLLLAALVFAWRREYLPALTVLVVACPCALVLATPTAFLAGIARGARSGILVKGGARLEAAGTVDAVCLDKTGTLTLGKPVVQRVSVLPEAGMDEATVLGLAAGAEQLSEHPLARAIVAAAEKRGRRPEPVDMAAAGFRSVPGKGVAARVPEAGGGARDVVVGRPEFLRDEAGGWPDAAQRVLEEAEREGQTALGVSVGGRPVAVIALADQIRPGAREAIERLHAAGVKRVVLLTGDREAPARAIAAQVGLSGEDVRAGLLPEDKVAFVKKLREAGHRVAMVGDGVNDAPALAAADVAIAMGAGGSDVALAAADVALMTDDIRQAADAITLSRKTVATVRQNLVFAAGWNVIAVVLAAVGGFGPVTGALVHNVGSVAVVVNAARLVTTRLR